MTPNYDAIARAEGDINIAILRLLEKYPLHARILEQAKVRARPEVGTMAVSVASDDLMLYHNPAFVLSLPPTQLGGVLLHEIHHVLFGHVTADPADFPDEWARTVAEEITVNEFVKEPLPKGVILLKQFPGLPRMESTQQRYDRLKKNRHRPPIHSPDTLGSPGQPSNQSAPAAGQPASEASEEQPDQQGGDDNDANEGENKNSGGGGDAAGSDNAGGDADGADGTGKQKQPPANRSKPKAKAGTLSTVDNHSVWQEAHQDLQQSKEVIRDAIQQAALEVGPEKIPDVLKGVCDDALMGVCDNQDIGSTPSEAEREIQGDGEGQLDWRRRLRRYVGEAVEVRPVFNRPPRRFPEMAGILPGRRRQQAKPKIMAVIDTSGSITKDLLQMIDGELARLAKAYKVKVVECDAMIHAVYDYKPIKKVQGGGGTDFCPPLEADFLCQHRPGLVVYFSDGYGRAPDKPPKVPLIWCLTPKGVRPAPWGKVIQMGKQPSGD